jgi:hypothetical protein
LDPKSIFSFRVKLLLAMMLIVLAVTGATLYLAEQNTQARYQEGLDMRFQSQMRLFTELQEAQLDAITERCRTLSRSVRLRAALEERDVDDLYRNALTELQGIFGKASPQDGAGPETPRASFFRFLAADGSVLLPAEHPAGLIEKESLDQTLMPMGKLLGNIKEQTVGYIALAQGNYPSALREVVLTKIADWDGKNLGALILGFPLRNMTAAESERDDAVGSGIWLGEQLYIEGFSAPDRRLLALRITDAMSRQPAGHFSVTLESGPHFVFYKVLDPKTQLDPA